MESIYLFFNDAEWWTEDGTEHGIIHRTDGPAHIIGDVLEWFFEGQLFNFDEWCKITNKTPEDILYLKLKYKIS